LDWETSSQVKLVRFWTPKAAWFLSQVEYGANTNVAILWKTGHIMGRSQMRGGGEYGWYTLYTWMSIDLLNCLKQPQERDWSRKKKNRGNEPNRVITHMYMEVPQGNSLCSYLKQAKMSFFFPFFCKIGEQEGRMGPA
jgi:hypothetical protein